MPQNFFVFIQCRSGTARKVGKEIIKKQIPEILDVSSVSGKWDLIVRVKIISDVEIDEHVLEAISNIEDILRTETVVAFNVYDPADIYF